MEKSTIIIQLQTALPFHNTKAGFSGLQKYLRWNSRKQCQNGERSELHSD